MRNETEILRIEHKKLDGVTPDKTKEPRVVVLQDDLGTVSLVANSILGTSSTAHMTRAECAELGKALLKVSKWQK